MSAIIDNYTDAEFSNIVMQSDSIIDVSRRLGYGSHSGSNGHRIRQRIKELGISTDHFSFGNKLRTRRNFENIFIKDSTANQKTLRKYYFEGNYSEYKCSICGQLPVWCGKELTLILDHINGENHDNRLENLRWVCPNCNQQLDTTNGKNIIHKRLMRGV